MNYNLKFEIMKKFRTQTNFSKKINEAEPAVSRVINGHENISDKRKKKWADVLQVPVKKIFE